MLRLYWFLFFLNLVCGQSFPSLHRLTVLPIPSVPLRAAVAFSLVFFKHKKHKHTPTPSPSYLSQSLRGHLVVVLSNKRLCCTSQPNAHLTCQRPLQVSSLWVLTCSGTRTHQPVTALTTNADLVWSFPYSLGWWTCLVFPSHPLPFLAEGCSHISCWRVSALPTSHSATHPGGTRTDRPVGKVKLFDDSFILLNGSFLENTVDLSFWRVNPFLQSFGLAIDILHKVISWRRTDSK